MQLSTPDVIVSEAACQLLKTEMTCKLDCRNANIAIDPCSEAISVPSKIILAITCAAESESSMMETSIAQI